MNRLLAITVGVALAVPALAARDSAGTYTLSPSSPFVTGTPISSSVMNTRFADLASELSDSLSRSGKGAMLAPLKLYDGSVTLPGLAFGSETGTGFYRAGAGDLRCSVTGTDRIKLTSVGLYVETTGGLFSDVLTARTATSATVKGAVADGASAVGVILDNSIALANATAKIASFRSNGAEKASISASGQLLAPALEIIQGNAFIDFKDSAAEDYDARIIKSTGANLEVVGTPLKVPTPVDATDAATKGYVDTPSTAAISSLHASLAAGPGVAKGGGRAWFTGSVVSATGNIPDAGDNFANLTGNLLFLIPDGFRPSQTVRVPIWLFDASRAVASRSITAYITIGTGGDVRIHVDGVAAGANAVENGDTLGFASVSWPL